LHRRRLSDSAHGNYGEVYRCSSQANARDELLSSPIWQHKVPSFNPFIVALGYVVNVVVVYALDGLLLLVRIDAGKKCRLSSASLFPQFVLESLNTRFVLSVNVIRKEPAPRVIATTEKEGESFITLQNLQVKVKKRDDRRFRSCRKEAFRDLARCWNSARWTGNCSRGLL